MVAVIEDTQTGPETAYIDAAAAGRSFRSSHGRPDDRPRLTLSEGHALVLALVGLTGAPVGARSEAEGSPRLDDVTKLGRWHVSVYPTVREVTFTTDHERRPPDPDAPTVKDPEASRRAAMARARTKVRRYCKANKLFRLVTLTYRRPVHDLAEAAADVAAFVKRLRGTHFNGTRFAYCWVPERHKSGALHLHVAIPTFIPKDSIADVWGLGFVDVRRLGKGHVSQEEMAHRAASYLAKYVGKTFETETEGGRGRHRYEVGQGFQPAKVSMVLQGEPAMLTGVVAGAWFEGEKPCYVWSSDDAPDWSGPPIRVIFFSP